MLRQGFRVSGHRGARALWPENTLDGCAGALALGVQALEIDVRLCAGGSVIVVHDPHLHPDLTRDMRGGWLEPPTPLVATLSLPAIRLYDVGRARPGSLVARAFPRQRAVDGACIPTLREVLELAARARVEVDLELKADESSGDDDDLVVALADAVAADLALAGGGPRCVPRSFDWRGLAHWRRRWPASPLAFLSDAPGGAVPTDVFGIARPGDTWAPHHATLTLEVVLHAKAAGLRIEPWTVNDPVDMRRLLEVGVDGFCTDAPDVANAVLGRC